MGDYDGVSEAGVAVRRRVHIPGARPGGPTSVSAMAGTAPGPPSAKGNLKKCGEILERAGGGKKSIVVAGTVLV